MSEGATYLLHFVPRYSLRTCGTLVSQTNLERSLLWLDDLAPGQVFVSGSRMITRDEIVSFAAMFDPQPFHIDEEAAKVSLFSRASRRAESTRSERPYGYFWIAPSLWQTA
jgi:hypothetical protein